MNQQGSLRSVLVFQAQNGLLQNGGPAVNQFKKMLGEEKTSAFIRTCMFCCE